MDRKAEIERMEAAFKRAAEKATRGTREERSGRFFKRDEDRGMQSVTLTSEDGSSDALKK